MMRIALVSEHASPMAAIGGVDSGGQNVYVAHVARQLGRAGHLVDVFTRRDSPHQPEVVRWARGVRVVHVPAGPAEFVPKEHLLDHMDAFGDWMAGFMRREGRAYDVMHANFFMSGIAAQRAGAGIDMPLVMTFHALGLVRRAHQKEADGFPDERFEIERRLLAEADRVIAECPQDRHDMVSLYGAAAARIDVVPCGFDPEELAPTGQAAARQALGWPMDEFIVLQLGRMVPRKGVDNVIRGIAALANSGRRARLYVVGGATDAADPRATPEIGRLMEVARTAGVADLVHFAGRRGRADLGLHYAACDVFVTTPWYEPFGITPVEAMACARPVIGSDVGGIRSTVVDEETGFLVPPHDPRALARRLAVLHANRDLARAMGFAGLARARRLFTWRRVAQGLLRSYANALAPRRERRVPAGRALRAGARG